MEYQVDIGGAQNIVGPIYLILAHQTAAEVGVPSKASNIAIFANLNARKNFIDIDGVRYPRDAVSIDYASNDYLDQCRDLEIFCYYSPRSLRSRIIKRRNWTNFDRRGLSVRN